MNTRHPFIALAMGVAFVLSGCEKVELENTNALPPEPLPLIRTDGLVAKSSVLSSSLRCSSAWAVYRYRRWALPIGGALITQYSMTSGHASIA